jgi:hypothetical protein
MYSACLESTLFNTRGFILFYRTDADDAAVSIEISKVSLRCVELLKMSMASRAGVSYCSSGKLKVRHPIR